MAHRLPRAAVHVPRARRPERVVAVVRSIPRAVVVVVIVVLVAVAAAVVREISRAAIRTAGVVSLAWTTLLVALPPIGATPFFPWQGVVAFGLLANACYLLGPATEILIEKMWGREVLPTGPVLYRMGLTFSVGLALLPTLIVTIIWVAQVVFAIF